ncbi:Hsp20/alpha crystallin family protein [Actinomycetospora chiangmaiensis]|uniref:Hsp20/alpha crystallin family protein n=1 Tax=Actinomycetospora chiangmaiensis TaxID=402650 RepID=UPI00038057CD|nr:Hsp20/alpha crystallin family protein [Actinomycetospora chiangmaiensis]
MLLNYDPVDAFRSLDRLTGWRGQPGTGMPMDLYRAGDHVVAAFDVPGVDPGSIEITAEGQTVTVKAERTAPADSGEWLVAERPRGRYSRQLSLGRDLDVERLHATYVDGVLSLTIPVAERAKPRQISVEHAAAPRSIDADHADHEAPASSS